MNDLLDPKSKNYNVDFANKINDLVKSKTVYNFESKKWGEISNGTNTVPGRTFKDNGWGLSPTGHGPAKGVVVGTAYNFREVPRRTGTNIINGIFAHYRWQ